MTVEPTRPQPARPSRRRQAVGLALLLSLGAQFGCGREFFRQWADQDVSEAVFEKSRDPRWRLDTYSIEPPSMSRFADPYDPDQPPAPPDDRGAEALSSVPQWPHNRLLVPAEGTGYLDMLEAGTRYESPKPEKTDPSVGTPGRAPLMPPTEGTSPFRAAPAAAPQPVPGPSAARNSGPIRAPLSPNTSRGTAPMPVTANGRPVATTATAAKSAHSPFRPSPSAPTVVASTKPTSAVSPNPPKSARRDQSVVTTAFQNPPAAGTTGTSLAATVPPRGANAAGDNPPADTPAPDVDPDPGMTNPVEPEAPTNRQPPDEYAAEGDITADLSKFLGIASEVDEAEAAGLAIDSRPYLVKPADAVNLALINSRFYQAQLEQIYIQALAVTLQRFAFEPQFVAGFSPQTATVAGIPSPNPINSFLYRTKEAPGGQASNLSLGTVAGVGKQFSTGGRLLLGFANTVTFNLAGKNARQPTVSSVLPLSFVQPFLRGGGRAVTLEPLTNAERQLLYQIRAFARFRQQFIPSILTSGQGVDSVTGATNDPSIGYLQVLAQQQQVSNDRETLEAFEQLRKAFSIMAKGGQGFSQINVDQINNSVQGARQQLITDELQYRNFLDQYKIQLGLPPDVPIVLDRGPIEPIRSVFKQLDRWFYREDRVPEELGVYLAGLPKLEEIVIDGRAVGMIPARSEELLRLRSQLLEAEDLLGSPRILNFRIGRIRERIRELEDAIGAAEPDQRALVEARNRPLINEGLREIDDLQAQINDVDRRRSEIEAEIARLKVQVEDLRKAISGMLEDLLLAAERVALDNRLDLMNQRAILYDNWRQLAVTANALLPIFTVTLNNQIFTPTNTTNPFAFSEQAKQFQLQINAELPLVRVNERNNFQAARIAYRRQQRALMAAEDGVKFGVRNEIRQILLQFTSYGIQKQLLEVNLRNKDNTVRQLFAPPGAGADAGGTQSIATVQQLTQSQQNILGAQNRLIGTWVNYQTQRLILYRDLGIIPYDEWEAYYELFPANATAGGAEARGPAAGADARGAAAGAAPAAGAAVGGRG